MIAPLNASCSPPTSAAGWLTERADGLLRPLLPHIDPANACLRISGRSSDHDARADRLESFTRPFHLFALMAAHQKKEVALQDFYAGEQWITCLDVGTQKASKAYWGPVTNYHQHLVEMGLLALSLEMVRKEVWEEIPRDTREQVLDWMETARGVATHWNNHLFFKIFVLEFLARSGRGRPEDANLIGWAMDEMETMYRAGGWFRDGMNETVDFYNAYAFYYYGLLWSYYYGQREPELVERWSSRARQFLEAYQLVFAADGSVPNFGRSQTYRFAALAPFGPALALDCCPIDASSVRRLTQVHLDYFLSRSACNELGILNIGWTDELPLLAESYSCEPSTYWASKGFSLLMLPPEHDFWAASPNSREECYADGCISIPKVGLTLRRSGGASDIINSGTAIGVSNLRFYASKWSKLVYRSSAGVLLPDQDVPFPADTSLRAEFSDQILGRHLTYPLETGEDFARCLYTLSTKTYPESVQVETLIRWQGNWLWVEHRVQATAPCRLRQGGFALGYAQASAARSAWEKLSTNDAPSDDYLGLENSGSISALQNLEGFERLETKARVDDQTPRRHTHFPYHVVPTLITDLGTAPLTLRALMYFGPQTKDALPWRYETEALVPTWSHPTGARWREFSLPHSLPCIAP